MIRNYIKISCRNLLKNKSYSILNIGGLAIGMTVAMLIGLWVFRELSFNKSHKNYDRIAQVMQHHVINGNIETWQALPPIMGQGLRDEFGSSFKHVVQASWESQHTLSLDDKIFLKTGNYFEPEVVEMFSIHIVEGSRHGLDEINSILISQSVKKIVFGEKDPIGKIIKLDNQIDVKVTGVYEDFPETSSFKSVEFMLPWKLFLSRNPGVEAMVNPWHDGSYTQTFVQLSNNVLLNDVSQKIKDIRLNKGSELVKSYKPEVFLHPMNKWHLYEKFENGKNVGGGIDNIWLFGFIGILVLLLACVNFMNLSTARSEKRAKEVGVRKAIGSGRRQLIIQFFSESFLISLLAFIISLLLIVILLPYFNRIANANVILPYTNPVFWAVGIAFSLFTGGVASIYPSLYLSSFKPVKVLKGIFKGGQNASTPRQVLVIVQFTISIVLVIGTIIVYQQINHAQERLLGYEKNGLISVFTTTETHNNIDAIRSTLINKSAIVNMTETSNPITEDWNGYGGFDWEGKDPNLSANFKFGSVNYDYGKTIGWEIKEGRDFSREFSDAQNQFILNETAVTQMNIKDPVGKVIRSGNSSATIVGVVKDLLIESPYEPVKPYIFSLSKGQEDVFIIKLNPLKDIKVSLNEIESVFKTYNPLLPFNVYFVDDQFAKKFTNEERIGRLVSLFAVLAIFISCLGLFGLASFIAEQRTKEIGIRKVVGASVFNLWQLLSEDFVKLVMLSIIIATPLAYYGVIKWLNNYTYRTEVSWWVFAIAGIGAIGITLFTVSFQALKVAITNPIKSLRTE